VGCGKHRKDLLAKTGLSCDIIWSRRRKLASVCGVGLILGLCSLASFNISGSIALERISKDANFAIGSADVLCRLLSWIALDKL